MTHHSQRLIPCQRTPTAGCVITTQIRLLRRPVRPAMRWHAGGRRCTAYRQVQPIERVMGADSCNCGHRRFIRRFIVVPTWASPMNVYRNVLTKRHAAAVCATSTTLAWEAWAVAPSASAASHPRCGGGMGSALHHAVPRGALRLRFAPGREHQAWARGVWASAHACDARLLGATMSNALLPNGEVLGDN